MSITFSLRESMIDRSDRNLTTSEFKMKSKAIRNRHAITLVEVIAISIVIFVMLGLLLPGLVSTRDRTRRDFCEQKLGRLALAVLGYEEATEFFPPAVMNPEGPIRSEATGMHHGWIALMLPFIEEKTLFDRIDPAISVYDEFHRPVRETSLSAVICPATDSPTFESDYAACHPHGDDPLDRDNEGIFYLNSQVRPDDVLDGLSHTLLIGEKRNPPGTTDAGWIAGTRATVRNTGTPPNATPAERLSDPLFVGGFGSWHPGIANLAMGDATVSAMSDSIDPIVYQQLGSRRDGTLQWQAQESQRGQTPTVPASDQQQDGTAPALRPTFPIDSSAD